METPEPNQPNPAERFDDESIDGALGRCVNGREALVIADQAAARIERSRAATSRTVTPEVPA